MPYHLNTDGEYSYHNFVNSSQWIDMGAGLVFGTKITKALAYLLRADTTGTGTESGTTSLLESTTYYCNGTTNWRGHQGYAGPQNHRPGGYGARRS